MKTTPDPVFVAYAASAPRLDLQFYLDYAARHTAEHSDRTLAIVYDMRNVVFKGSPASQKRIVWALIQRFKASIPDWYGNAGSREVALAEDGRTSAALAEVA